MAKKTAQPPATRESRTARAPRTAQFIRARYDAAQTNDDNKRHWAAVDYLSADASNNIAVRKTLRSRGRYEVANNSYAKGIALTLANDTVGTGPTLQMQIEGNDALNSEVEADFAEWAQEIRLAEKLRLMRYGRCDSGEVFAVLATNPMIASDVKLDVALYEGDQVTDPTWTSGADPSWCDGIHYDAFGNPISYRLLRQHPGSQYWMVSSLDYDDVPARLVFHYFRPDRPGQRRGIPDVTPALPLFAELRRYCAAVIAAAETAADYALTIESDAGADGEIAEAEEMDTFSLEKRMATVLPKGWKMSQTKAEQPTTTYDMFVNKKLAEVSRCLNVPFTIAALDSSESNLSARYLDAQIYAKSIGIDRADFEVFLNRLLDEWLTEWIRIRQRGALPDRFPHQWFWPSIGDHADPDKVASAQAQRLKNGTSNLAMEIANQGQDWEKVQNDAARTLGLKVEEYRKRLADAMFPPPQMQQSQPGRPPGD